MTGSVHSSKTVVLLALLLLLVAVPAHGQELSADEAAVHPERAWKIRKAEFYRYLVEYYGMHPSARVVLPDYLRQRLIQAEARKLGITVTDRDVERWIEALDRRVKVESGGAQDLRALIAAQGMTEAELRRRGKVAIMRERVARAEMVKRDKTRDPNRELEESAVLVVINTLYTEAPKVLDRSKLPKNVVARIGETDITVYEYGRELAISLPKTEVVRALNALILVKEVQLLLGNDDPPSEADFDAQKAWFMTFEKNRLGRLTGGKQEITDKMVEEFLAGRGLTLEVVFNNPAFLAQARARGHFKRSVGEEELKRYYEENKRRYGDQLKVARILVVARAQRVKLAGKKVRNLEQGRTLAEALWVRAQGGEEFATLARKNSEDPDVIRKNGGEVPFWLTAETPGYEDTWTQANALEDAGISRPFFSQGRGYVIVKLLERRRALGFEGLKSKIRRDAAEQSYLSWRFKVVQAALKSPSLLEEEGR